MTELVQAFVELGKSNPVRLLIVGQPEPNLDPVPEPVRAIMQQDRRIVMAGFQEDIRPWIIAADVFVFPSYREGFPNVVLQACALETACIVTDINGCNEIIQDGVSGIIVKPKDAIGLQLGMEDLLKNPAKREQYARMAHGYVCDNFDQQVLWSEILNEYQDLLKHRVPPHH